MENGLVTLSGIVEGRSAKRLAEDIAEKVWGVDDVNNQLKVRHETTPTRPVRVKSTRSTAR